MVSDASLYCFEPRVQHGATIVSLDAAGQKERRVASCHQTNDATVSESKALAN